MEDASMPSYAAKAELSSSGLDRILDAALLEFGEHGIEATRMENIAARAAQSKQLIYYYYKNKQELYADVIDKVCVEMHQPFLDMNFDALSPMEAIRAYFCIVLDINQKTRHRLATDQTLVSGEFVKPSSVMYSLGPKVLEILTQIIARGQEDGTIGHQTDATMIFLQVNLMATGFQNSMAMMSKYLCRDLSSDSTAELWREHVLRSMMRAVAPADKDCCCV
jgi:AcrR family transcriptional regulator